MSLVPCGQRTSCVELEALGAVNPVHLLDSWPHREDLFLETDVAYYGQTRKGGPLAGCVSPEGAVLHLWLSGYTGQLLVFPLAWPWA